MEGGGALCEDTSVTHPVKSDHPDFKDKLDVPHTSSDNDGADSGVWSEVSRPRGSSIPDTRQHKSKENMEGGGAQCEDTSVTHPVQSDDPDVKDKLDDLHTRDDDAGSTVCIEASRPRGIDFPITQPHKKRMEKTAANSHGQSDRMSLCSDKSIPTGPCFGQDNVNESLIHQSEVCKRCKRSCGVCLGNVHQAAKHCETCRVSYCETHVADHYKSPAFSSHELADYKSRVSPAKEQSLQRSSSGSSWELLIILSVLMFLTFHCCYCPEDPVELPELRVMMLGQTGTGKSASGNTILGREAFKSEASALPVTQSCDSQSGVVEGRNITVIDTPAITSRKAAWLSERVEPGPHVFLLVIPLGIFTEEDGEEVKWIQRTFGEEALKFTIVLFTGGDQMDQINVEQFLNESSGLQTLVNSTRGGYHIFDNNTPRGRGQVKGLLKKIELLLRKNTGYSYSYDLHEQVKIAVREEEERKRREEEEEKKREKMERDIQVNQVIKTMQKRIERKIRGQMKLKMITRIANATATLNELREVVKATTEQIGNCLQEQVKTAVREEDERKRREEEEERKRRKEEEEMKRLEMERDMQFNQVMKNMEKRIEREIRGQMKLKLITRITNATATLNELREVVKATTEQIGNCLQEQVKTALREEEERKRREEEEERKRREEEEEDERKRRKEEEEKKRRKEEEERKRLKMERDMQFNQVIKNMEKRIEREIRGQMKLKLITRIANATATLNEFREVVKATTEQSVNSLQEQVRTAEGEEEAKTGQSGTFLIYLVGVVSGLIGLTGLFFLILRRVVRAKFYFLSYLSGVVIELLDFGILKMPMKNTKEMTTKPKPPQKKKKKKKKDFIY